MAYLLTHGAQDPALAVYPFFSDWFGARNLPASSRFGFLLQAAVLFLIPYLLWLSFVLLVVLAERAFFGPKPKLAKSRRPFRRLNIACLFVLSTAVGASSGSITRKLGGDVQVGPLLVAAAPFAAALLAPIPALLILIPTLALMKVKQ